MSLGVLSKNPTETLDPFQSSLGLISGVGRLGGVGGPAMKS